MMKLLYILTVSSGGGLECLLIRKIPHGGPGSTLLTNHVSKFRIDRIVFSVA